jgi:hypothetical protein
MISKVFIERPILATVVSLVMSQPPIREPMPLF